MRSFLPGGAADHPRIRGEHINHQRNAKGRDGSSPHTRGARVATPPYPAAPRIIPAYAGSTLAHGSRAGQWPDHPRIRGEHTYEKTGSYLEPGSSPHTRGARRRRGWRRRRVRIIPAYAGSTHPPGGRRVRRFGSSPHTRGARGFEGVGPLAPGIIPAYAGSTPKAAWASSGNPDHPRIRGEHRLETDQTPQDAGSSPHTRGAPAGSADWTRWSRIIPAYAGSTTMRACSARSGADHPRIRGEHTESFTTKPASPGSSPHTRGAPGGRAPHTPGAGIIPAYAGSTNAASPELCAVMDHPRIRGEHISCSRFVPAIMGSSPHTRGARQTPGSSMRNTGIIPAYAGST